MTRTFFLLAAAAAFAACGDDAPAPPANPLLGTWTLDVDAVVSSLPPDQQEMARAAMAQGRVELTFTEDRLKNVKDILGRASTEETAYRIGKRDGNRFTLVTSDGEVTATVDGDRLVIEADDEKIFYKRK